jgi:phosphoserine phosphatase
LNASSTTAAADFVQTVLGLMPEVAVFDCDGTLWAGDAGEGFFDWELKHGLVSEDRARWARARYADYKAGKVDEDSMCGEMVTLHRGLRAGEVMAAATEYFEGFRGAIFPEMQEIVHKLQQAGCAVWAVSSTNEWVIEAAMRHFGISPDRILAAAVEIDNDVVTDRLLRVPTGPGKPRAIQEIVRRAPDAAFGNSRWDTEMLAMSAHPFAVNPNPDLEATARAQGWRVYFPDKVRPAR